MHQPLCAFDVRAHRACRIKLILAESSVYLNPFAFYLDLEGAVA